MTRITREQLIAFAAGDLDGAEAEAVAAHVAANPHAARSVDLYRSVAATAEDEDTTPAPAELVARAKVIFRDLAAAPRGLMDRLHDVIARLVYDSRLQPAANRATAAADRIQLSFESGECEIDLSAEPIAGLDAGADRWRVVGQVLADAVPGPLTVTVVGADAEPVTEVRTDDRAMFALELPRGRYDLRIAIDAHVIVLPGIEIG